MIRNDRTRMAQFYHSRIVTILGDVMRIAASYLARMSTPPAITCHGRSGDMSGVMPGRYPGRYHRAISLGAWMGMLTAGSLCWAFILSSI